jgi:hypothetical protein
VRPVRPLVSPLPSFGGAANPALDVAPGGVFFRPGSPGAPGRDRTERGGDPESHRVRTRKEVRRREHRSAEEDSPRAGERQRRDGRGDRTL